MDFYEANDGYESQEIQERNIPVKILLTLQNMLYISYIFPCTKTF